MTDTPTPAPAGQKAANVVSWTVQITALVALVAYAIVAELHDHGVDRWVIVTIACIALGARPETFLGLFPGLKR